MGPASSTFRAPPADFDFDADTTVTCENSRFQVKHTIAVVFYPPAMWDDDETMTFSEAGVGVPQPAQGISDAWDQAFPLRQQVFSGYRLQFNGPSVPINKNGSTYSFTSTFAIKDLPPNAAS